MKRLTLPLQWVAPFGLGLALMAPLQATFAFGGAGNLGECTTFTTCTAGVSSTAVAISQYEFTAIKDNYQLPLNLVPGMNERRDQRDRQTNVPLRAAVGDFCVNCGNDNPFFSSAIARSQSDFAVNRASAQTSVGVSGHDVQTFGQQVLGSANVQVQTVAEARSAWRDAWAFNADGHFNASIRLDGTSGINTSNPFFPSSFNFTLSGTQGGWFYDLKVWDVSNLSFSEFFEVVPARRWSPACRTMPMSNARRSSPRWRWISTSWLACSTSSPRNWAPRRGMAARSTSTAPRG